MSSFNRRKLILDILQKNKEVSINDLSIQLKVSTMTIRRDLSFFSSQGLVTLVQGGATLNTGAIYEHTIPFKQTEKINEKQKICEMARNLIKEGNVIFLDSGSTNQILANLIGNMKNIVVITHSLLVANSLIYSNNIKLIMLPGIFREKSMAFLGNSTVEFIKKFKIDIAFLSCEGADLKFGATLPDISDSEVKAAASLQAEKKVLLTDSSKFGKSFLSSFCKLQDFDLIITDEGVNEELKEKMLEEKINLKFCK